MGGKFGLHALPPPAMLALLHAAFIALGAVLLRLPAAHVGAVGWSEAIFTSVSAVTVTGFVVVDTGSAYTLFGQAVIAALIQLGGLGLMVFAVFVLSALGIDIGAPSRAILREELGHAKPGIASRLGGLRGITRLVVIVARACEAVGIVALAFVFVPEFGWRAGLWQATFHTVSAFNNAGFELFPDSLSGYVGDWRVDLFVPAMFILGGLGFVAIGDVFGCRFRCRPMALHTKLMLAGTGAAIAVAWIGVAALVWPNPGTLGPLDAAGKFRGSWFQAVTPRTAGFNTIDTSAMEPATALLTMVLMVIGGGPTWVAGGSS